MLTKEQFLDKVKKYNPNLDENLIGQAYDFSKKYHEGQYRKSSEPFFVHPISVAISLINFGLDQNTIISALLHDVVEDTDATIEEVQKLFGNEVALLVDGVTKLNLINLRSTTEKSSENFRKLVMSMSKDIRVLIIKLADRLDNMRTLQFVSVEKQEKKSRETLLIYAPLAERIGMRQIKNELEDLAFKYLHSKERKEIV
ncbi:HD domain-containing protein, partial [Pseudomonadota bacterium]